jgi:hypothetical protein
MHKKLIKKEEQKTKIQPNKCVKEQNKKNGSKNEWKIKVERIKNLRGKGKIERVEEQKKEILKEQKS